MEFSRIVRGQPGQYLAEAGILLELEERLTLFRRPVVITGEKSYAALVSYLGHELSYPVLKYDGTASYEDMERLAGLAEELGADVLIGIGGGKVLDTTKGTAERMGVDLVLIPTLVATCACSTPVVVVYNPNHTFKTLDYGQRSGFMTVVDYDFLVHSPASFLLSGVSDTLAKWYELEIIHRGKNRADLPALVQLALATARVTLDILLADTHTALQDHARGEVTSAFKRIVDTVYAVAANVGCQTSEFVSGAHALHNGLTTLPETHAVAHGLKVSYGILVQLCVTGDEEEVQKLLPFYKQNNFLYRWEQLGVTGDKQAAREQIARAAVTPQESYRFAKAAITAEEVLAAMERLDTLVSVFEGESDA